MDLELLPPVCTVICYSRYRTVPYYPVHTGPRLSFLLATVYKGCSPQPYFRVGGGNAGA
jgi:hypothetical protein